MTITERIKQELFNADINYQDVFDRLQKAEGMVAGLLCLSELRGEELETECRRLINEYNNAETEEAALSAEQAYYKLYSIRK